MAGCQANNSSVSLDGANLIECTICLDVIGRPAYQCSNGHLVCSTCSNEITLCPTCRIKMPNPKIRNLVAESLVTPKCPNFKWGCKLKITAEEKAQHLLRCEYAASDFCRRVCLPNDMHCTKFINKREILSHMKNEHKLEVYESCEKQIIQEADHAIENLPKKWSPIIFAAFEEQFFLVTEATPGQYGSTSILSWKLISAGSNEVAKNFLVELTLVNDEEDLALKWEGKVISIDELQERNLKCFSVTLDTLKQFNKRLDCFQWTINIVIKRKQLKNVNQLPPSVELPESKVKLVAVPLSQQENLRPANPRIEDRFRSEAAFRFTVPEISSLRHEFFSRPHYIRNLPWKIRVKPNIVQRNRIDSIGIYVHCNEGTGSSSNWSCRGIVSFKIIAMGQRLHYTGADVCQNFCSRNNYGGHEHFVSWATLMNQEKGLLTNNSIKIEVKIKAEVPRGL